jgi:hypothetical protein
MAERFDEDIAMVAKMDEMFAVAEHTSPLCGGLRCDDALRQ